MTDAELEQLRFPIGRVHPRSDLTSADRRTLRDRIADAPAQLRSAVAGLGREQLDTPYRPDGWTVRQVVHHVPDSHMNALIRFKLALTEEVPTIRPYDEAAWALLSDGLDDDIETSLTLLEAVHARWLRVIDAMTEADFGRELVHPEIGRITLDTLLQIYAWHGPHHVAHVTSLRKRNGW
ncbi:MAG: putative metal-dependent hydrolase [Gemmatimonadetes bacterium]|nr:putative metal-dependent hydrolase [Gemmatimonadota bacterium]MBT8404992.1 putative metal-dependent hydrolase [Gemmatimonadota bacterium]